MSIGLIILSIILIFLLYVLLFPVTIKADTEKNIYFVRLPGVFGFRIIKNITGWRMRFSVFFIRFSMKIPPAKKPDRKKDEKRLKKIGKQSRKRFKTGYLSYVLKLVKAFRIRKLYLNIDTGDYPLNARLIPVTFFLSNNHINLSVNFNDYNSLYLIFHLQLIEVLYISIRHFMFNL